MKFLQILLLFLIIALAFIYKVYGTQSYQYNNFGNNLLFVVDFSNSMGEYLEHTSKFTQVKKTFNKIMPQISPETKVGLRVYGHTCNPIALNACRSSELLVPLAENNVQKVSNAIQKLRPRGMTPITYSLKQAVKKDLMNCTGLKHIILLTDGGENCDESPCEYAIKLVQERRDIKIDVIAFDVHDSEDLDQLRCTADVTGGEFIEARTNAQLVSLMEDLILPHKEVKAFLYKNE